MKYNIYNQSGTVKAAFEADSSCTHDHKVQTDNVLNLTFILTDNIGLEVNDYILIGAERFTLMEPYQPEQKSTLEYAYNVKFYGAENIASKAIFVYTEYRPITQYYDTPAGQLAYIVACINRVVGSNVYSVGAVVSSAAIQVDYPEGCNCLEALTTLSAAVGTEWWLDVTSFNLTKCEFGTPIVLGYKQGLLSLSKEVGTSSDFYTRLIPFGSSKNIVPATYGHQTLQLPAGAKYVDMNADVFGVKEHYEAAAFSDIFPRFTGTVGTVRTEQRTIEGIERTIYYFTSPGIPFNPNDYTISETVKHVVFKSGDLMSQDFEANWYPESGEWELILQYPSETMQLPGGNVIPRTGDTYTVYNLNMPAEYYPLAEAEFQAAVEALLADHAVDYSVYKAPTDHVYLEKNNIHLAIGQLVKLMSDVYFPTGYRDSRITRVVRKLSDLNDMDIEISNQIIKTSYSQLKEDVNSIQTTLSQRLSDEIINIIKSYQAADLTDDNVLSSLRVLREIAKHAISREVADTAQGLITFLQGLKTLGNLDIGTFIGGLAGSGGRITPQGHAEMRSLRLWESLEVPELRYNRVEVIAGTSWRSQGGGIIESVTMQPDNINGTAILKLEEGDIGRVALDDLCMGIWHYSDGNDTDNHDDGMGNFRFAGFGTSYFRITAVRGANNNEFDFTMRPISERYTKHYLPQPGMHFAQRGNPTLTERQKITYETPAYVRLLVGVTTWEYSQSNISMQYGDLSNLSVFGINVDALGSLYANHVVMTGVIDQSDSVPDRIEFSWSNGSSVSLNGATDVTALIYNTWTDVTSSYETFTWTRDSGHPQDDAAWNATHVNHGNVLTLTWADLPAERVLFTVTADKPGEMIEGQIVIV